jgi:hypothetical protein
MKTKGKKWKISQNMLDYRYVLFSYPFKAESFIIRVNFEYLA